MDLTRPSNTTEPLGSLQSLRRIQKELAAIERDPPPRMNAWPRENDWYHWQGTILGRPDSVYGGGIFLLDIRFPPDYPRTPPDIRFETKVYHPNISADGVIALDILHDQWCPALTIATILIMIDVLLLDPWPQGVQDVPALVPEINHVWNTDRARFEATAREWTREYAMKSDTDDVG